MLLDANRRTAVVTWDVATGVESRRPLAGPADRPGVRKVPQACSPDGRTLAYFDLARHGVLLWDADADRQRGPALRAPTSRLAAHAGAAFTPDGRSLVVCQTDGRAEVWDLSGPRLARAIRVHPEGYDSNSVQFAPDGRLMATTGLGPHTASPLAWAWTLGFRLAPGWSRRVSTEVVVVDLATGARLARADGSAHARFSPDGRSVATTEPDGTIAIRAVPRPPTP